MNIGVEQLNEIETFVKEKGSLTKKEIDNLYKPSDAEWRKIRAHFEKVSGVETASRRIGGFQVRTRKPSKKIETIPASLLKYAWESEAVDGLVSVLDYASLENLLGSLAYTVRVSRRARTGENRRGTRHEIATALMIRHGRDLFADPEIRKVVGHACGLKECEIPGRWTPGKDAAIAFVKKTGFPEELIGIPSEGRRPDYEYIEGRPNLGPLVEFQQELKSKILSDVLHQVGKRHIASLPTGAGKTRVAVESIREWMSVKWSEERVGEGNSVLWLAHTEELCEQAYECFKQVWEANSNNCPAVLFRFWGQYTNNLTKHAQALDNLKLSPCILISTPQRISNLLVKEQTIKSESTMLIRNLRFGVGSIVIDEAHRAAAPTYRNIIEDFGRNNNPNILGLTATPFRTHGTDELRSIFGTILTPDRAFGDSSPKEFLQRHEYLAKPEWNEIETNTIMKLPTGFFAADLGEDDIVCRNSDLIGQLPVYL